MAIESDLFNSFNTKVLLLLGAGASKPLGMPLMREFHDLISMKLEKEQREVLRDISLTSMDEADEVTPDLEALLALIERYRKFYDILFGDKRFGFIVEKEWEERVKLIATGLLDAETGYPTTHTPPDWLVGAYFRKETLESIDTSLRNLMFEEYGKSLDSYRLDELYSPLLKVIMKHSSQGFIPVFTTNYDMAIETYAQQSGVYLETGFDSTPTGNIWKPGRFYQFQPASRKLNIVLFKLHGALTYHRKGNSIISTGLPIRDPAGYQSAIIYPTQTKEYPDEEPFRTAYGFLKGCFSIARFAVIIGYSFRDPGIRRILIDTLELNPNLLFIIVCGSNVEQWKQFAQQNLRSYHIISHPFDFTSNGAPYLEEVEEALAQNDNL